MTKLALAKFDEPDPNDNIASNVILSYPVLSYYIVSYLIQESAMRSLMTELYVVQLVTSQTLFAYKILLYTY